MDRRKGGISAPFKLSSPIRAYRDPLGGISAPLISAPQPAMCSSPGSLAVPSKSSWATRLPERTAPSMVAL